MSNREVNRMVHGDTTGTALASRMAHSLLSHGREVLIRIENCSLVGTGQTTKNDMFRERERPGTHMGG